MGVGLSIKDVYFNIGVSVQGVCLNMFSMCLFKVSVQGVSVFWKFELFFMFFAAAEKSHCQSDKKVIKGCDREQ